VVDAKFPARPFLGGKITPQTWLAGYAGDDRKIKANARAEEGERIADYITALEAALSRAREEGARLMQEAAAEALIARWQLGWQLGPAYDLVRALDPAKIAGSE
jgi:hypothetical protein